MYNKSGEELAAEFRSLLFIISHVSPSSRGIGPSNIGFVPYSWISVLISPS